MLTLLVFLFLLLVFDIAAMHWGVDSRDGLESREWQRGQHFVWF